MKKPPRRFDDGPNDINKIISIFFMKKRGKGDRDRVSVNVICQ